MITNLKIENFKAFRSLDLRMCPLTVLTGLNGAGKSTVIQALLLAELARESVTGWVPLNGPFGLALGEAADVLHSDASEPVITLEITGPSGVVKVSLGQPDDDRSVMLSCSCHVPTSAEPGGRIDTYLSAERLGPRDLLEVSAESDARLRVGHQGQFTPHVLARRERSQVREALRHPRTAELGEAITMSGQVRLWVEEILRPVWVHATWLMNTNAAMVRFRDLESKSADWRRPGNDGFGLSYSLPIIVGALTAEQGALFLVENPEAHLHPAGQSAVGRFLGRLAASGVQTVIETHSDHVINGIRLAVARDRTIEPADILVHFFGGGPTETIEMGPTGSLSAWPAGFFDQAEADLIQLSRVRRRD
jgi:predicted ATPase